MGLEIERKFLVKDDSWRDQVEYQAPIVQGYLANDTRLSVRVRKHPAPGHAGDVAFLTIKSATVGLSRSEYEYPIPPQDAIGMLTELAIAPLIEKTRYFVRVGAHLWEIDVFDGANSGLVVAEIELAAEDEPFEMPSWAGREVSGDARYYNVNLAFTPYSQWATEISR